MSMKNISTYIYNNLTDQEKLSLLKRSEQNIDSYIEKAKPIIEAVKEKGDEALKEFAYKFDNVTQPIQSLKANEQDFKKAYQQLDADLIETLKFAAENIKNFHEKQKPEEIWFHEVRPGVFAGEKTTAIDSVACYVPRGKGSFPSVMLMTIIPAVIAGVPQISVLTPPAPDGDFDAASLVAADIAGVKNIYKCGGAQAVAAAAYGTKTIPKSLKIVGPGSPWVVAAKKSLSHIIDPGLPAGPSESLVLADETAHPDCVALDLLVEAEHGPDSSAYLVTNSSELAEKVKQKIPDYWKEMSKKRVDYSSTVLCGNQGGVIITDTIDEAIDFVNDYAAEHLVVSSQKPFDYLDKIRNAGEILLGTYTPIPLGNFVLGPNAVLPTSAHAKTSSPLSVYDFTKRISIGYTTEKSYPEMAKHALQLAKYEGFDAHANAVSDLRNDAIKDDRTSEFQHDILLKMAQN